MSSVKDKEAKDSIAKAKKAKEQKDLEDALEVGPLLSLSSTVNFDSLVRKDARGTSAH